MKKNFFILIVILTSVCVMAGCEKIDGIALSEGTQSQSGEALQSAQISTDAALDTLVSRSDENMFTKRDARTEYDEDSCISISLNRDSAKSSSECVKISETTITLTNEGTYLVSGSLDNGMIIVDAPESAKLQLVFNGASINSASSAALYIRSADKVFITLADKTENTLSNSGVFTAIDENNIDAALFSKQDLTINGGGSLTVKSPAGHGIVCKDDLVFTGGSYTVIGALHGISANDSVRITGDTRITVDAGKDAVHCENDDNSELGFVYISNGYFKMEADGDGISAGADLQIKGGSFDLLTGGGSENGSHTTMESEGGFMGGRPGGGKHPWGDSQSDIQSAEDSVSAKGIKSAKGMLISGGEFIIDSADDSLHSDLFITVSGGSFEISSGDDAIHAEDSLTITAGVISIDTCYEGLEALHINISAGEIRLTASDDGLNAAGGSEDENVTQAGGRSPGRPGGMSAGNGSIVISGGNLYIKASGDGIDSNGTLNITGGYTVVCGPSRGDTSTLDYDRSASITGGTFIGTGASGMAQTFSENGQGIISLSVGSIKAGEKIILSDKDGRVLIEYAPELDYAVVILSTPDMISGECYTVTVGSYTKEFNAD